ncbi:MAG: nucleotidyltransferase family protein [Tannerellaceae bacterium]|jgi:NDP-sugar pyrophosphorylase family protein|nr:nucleotidyltransferase family protein [Tannerellaceae bacterium]
MKAIIFAAGLGTRLKPLTNAIPKALVPLNGKPMLEHIIVKLKEAGCHDIVINIHHLGQLIIDFLKANDNFGLTIHISDERKYLLDTGGGLKQASKFLDGKSPFIAHNVDILSDVDLRAFYSAHKPDAMATLLTSKRETTRRLLFDKKNNLRGWQDKKTGEVKSYYRDFDPSLYIEHAFGGIHIISPNIFNEMDDWTGKFSIIDFYLSACGKNKINPWPAPEVTIFDIGSPESLSQAERWLSAKNANNDKSREE